MSLLLVSMTDPNINRLLAKRYQIQELIGTGAMSRVYTNSNKVCDR